MAQLSPETSVRYLKGVGPKSAARLARLGIKTIKDLIYHFPIYYQDFRQFKTIKQLQLGETVSVKGKVVKLENRLTRRGKTVQQIVLEDQGEFLELVWFNQPFRLQGIKEGAKLLAAGQVKKSPLGRWQIVNPLIEKGGSNWQTGRLLAVYPETEGVTSSYLRKIIATLLPHLSEHLFPDYFPPAWRQRYQLLPRWQALRQIHAPSSLAAAQQARCTLAFEELFLLQLPLLYRQQKERAKLAPAIKWDAKLATALAADLPFQLTPSQRQALEEIAHDLQQPFPMNRLLEGDVGTGKTIVAALVAAQVAKAGWRAVLMAPTEILAWQHYQNLQDLFRRWDLEVGIWTSQFQENTEAIFLIGTHALFHHRQELGRLGLVIIDEQHRFGVSQRAQLVAANQDGSFPHVLTMTATPIPRTVSLVLRGNLAVSRLTDLLPGRQPVTTFVVPPAKRMAAYRWVAKEIRQHQAQVFIVCPFIESSETLQSVRAATEEFVRLEKIFAGFRLALLHGRLKSQEKAAILKKMQAGKIDILVTTPVVEVGVDLPRAKIIIIENAERFGLAQLHQLRGRVGRNREKAYCLLFSEAKSRQSQQRLRLLTKLRRGLELAEADLKLRGPGELLGTQQHGFPRLKLASWLDLDLVTQTHRAAEQALAIKKGEYWQRWQQFLADWQRRVALN